MPISYNHNVCKVYVHKLHPFNQDTKRSLTITVLSEAGRGTILSILMPSSRLDNSCLSFSVLQSEADLEGEQQKFLDAKQQDEQQLLGAEQNADKAKKAAAEMLAGAHK